jgi:tight adherence protein C
MTALLVIIGLLFVGAAIWLVARAVWMPGMRIAGQLRQIESYGGRSAVGPNTELPLPDARFARLGALAARIGDSALGTAPWLKPLPRRQLTSAGLYTVSMETFHGYRLLAAVGVPALLLLDGIATGSVGIFTVLLVVVACASCWVLPATVVKRRAQRRLNRIDRDLPELIDVLTATIEAGIGFGGTLQLVSDRFEGPLGEELRLMLQEQTMGLATDQALYNMLDRCETPALRAFVRAVAQGEALGVSIGTALRNLATESRDRRRQSAREQAQKAPVKLLFPLIFLIFPAMLIVLLYPAIHALLHNLHGVGA